MDAKARKVLNGLTKLGGEQEVFDLSIAIKMTEDAVQALLGDLSGEGLVSCRRDDSGKEFWSVAEAKPAPPPEEPGSGAKEPASGAPGRKKGKATAAGPDDRFDEFIVDPAATAAPPAAEVYAAPAASPPPAPAPIPPEPAEADDSFEPKPPAKEPADDRVTAADGFEPKPPKKEKRAKADADFEPKPEKETPAKPSKKKASDLDDDAFEPKSAKESKAERELSAGPDDHFDEFAERVPSKPNLPIPLMAGAAVLALIVILFIVGGGGGKTKRIDAAVNGVKTELTGKLDSLAAATAAEIEKLRADNKALSDEVKVLRAELRKAGSQDAKKAAADKAKQPAKKR